AMVYEYTIAVNDIVPDDKTSMSTIVTGVHSDGVMHPHSDGIRKHHRCEPKTIALNTTIIAQRWCDDRATMMIVSHDDGVFSYELFSRLLA
ncbi:MAG: hypothetical protein AAF429_15235, partial [Pseudomonadota bacterium]